MSLLTRGARGTSAFTSFDQGTSQPMSGAGLIGSTRDAAPQTTWDLLIDRLLVIRGLKDDWDGQGAEAPNPLLVDGAIKLAVWLKKKGEPPATHAFAGLGGTVYFEWHTAQSYSEIEVMTPVYAEWRGFDKEGDGKTLTGSVSLQGL